MRLPLLCAGAAVSFAVLAALPGYAFAHEDDGPPPPRRNRAPTRDPMEYRSDQNAALELRLGPYRPRVDEEFANGATPFSDIYGTGQNAMIGLEVDWQAVRIPHFGTFGPGVGLQFTTFSANAPFTNRPGLSQQASSLWILPISALAVLRIDALHLDFDIPVVPYAKVGLTYALWEARDGGSTSLAQDGVEGAGASFGYQWHAGGMLVLDFFAPQTSVDMDNSTGVNHAYVFWEWMWSDVSSLGRGMQVGTSTWVAGIAIEF